MIPEMGRILFSWLKFPIILGSDVAGTVVDVGSAVTRFQPGDRVVAHALGFTNGASNSAEGAFQEFVLVRDHMAAAIPDHVRFEEAAVVPLGLSTAACGLYQRDHLAMALPRVEEGKKGEKGMEKEKTKAVLIWGGSTSVGANAIQLAIASGYEVFTTCSPHNFEFVKKLGASRTFDYKERNVVDDIVGAFEGKDCAGALAIGDGSVGKCVDVAARCKGNKFVSMASLPIQVDGLPDGLGAWVSLVFAFVTANLRLWWRCKTKGVKTKFIFGSDLADNEVGKAVWVDFLGEAMKQGKFVPSPEPLVVPGKGLEKIQEAFEMQKKGVSARKIVVSLSGDD